MCGAFLRCATPSANCAHRAVSPGTVAGNGAPLVSDSTGRATGRPVRPAPPPLGGHCQRGGIMIQQSWLQARRCRCSPCRWVLRAPTSRRRSRCPTASFEAAPSRSRPSPRARRSSIDSLAPGTTAVRPMTVINDGTLAADVVVTPSKKAGITEFYEALTCKVTCGGRRALRRPAGSRCSTAPIRLAPGARGEMRFEVGLPADAGNDSRPTT